MHIVAVDNNQADLFQLTEEIATLLPNSHLRTFTDPLLSAKYICDQRMALHACVQNCSEVA